MPKSSPIRGTTREYISLLRLYYKVATFEPELREYVFCTTAVLQSCEIRARFLTTDALQSCDFRAGAPGVRLRYYGCTTKLRLSSTFSLLRLRYKVATFEHVFFTTAVLQSCDFQAGAPEGSKFSLLRLRYKAATFEPELREYVSFSTAVLQSCDLRASFGSTVL